MKCNRRKLTTFSTIKSNGYFQKIITLLSGKMNNCRAICQITFTLFGLDTILPNFHYPKQGRTFFSFFFLYERVEVIDGCLIFVAFFRDLKKSYHFQYISA